MSSDFAKIWYTKVFECAEHEYEVKNLVRTFFDQKTYVFWGWVPQKMTEIESLSDFDEIWYPGVVEGADFKNRIHFYVESFVGGR